MMKQLDVEEQRKSVIMPPVVAQGEKKREASTN